MEVEVEVEVEVRIEVEAGAEVEGGAEEDVEGGAEEEVVAVAVVEEAVGVVVVEPEALDHLLGTRLYGHCYRNSYEHYQRRRCLQQVGFRSLPASFPTPMPLPPLQSEALCRSYCSRLKP